MVVIEIGHGSEGGPAEVGDEAFDWDICTLILEDFNVGVFAHGVIESAGARFKACVHFGFFLSIFNVKSTRRIQLSLSLHFQIRFIRYLFILPWPWIILPRQIKHSKLKPIRHIRPKRSFLLPPYLLNIQPSRILLTRIYIRSRTRRFILLIKNISLRRAQERMMWLFRLQSFLPLLSVIREILLRTWVELVRRFCERSIHVVLPPILVSFSVCKET